MPEDRTEFDFGPNELRHWAEISTRYGKGLIDDANVLPKVFAGDKWDTRIKKLADFFNAAGFMIVSQRCADVFSSFDLGCGGLYPIQIYQGNRRDLAATDPYYILNFGCQKRAFIPDLSSQTAFYNRIPVEGDYYRYSAVDIANGDCVVSKLAVSGPDIWIDPTVSLAFFMSNRLTQALKSEKLTSKMFLSACSVVG
jgi:hypothetical protein